MDKNDTVPMEQWYYSSKFMLFLCLGPYIDKILTWIGAYFIFVHEKNKFKTYLLAYPIGLAIAKIIWLLQVTSHEEFHAVPSWVYYGYGIVSAIILIYICDYLSWFKFHRQDAVKQRKKGLQQIAPLVPAEQWRDKAMETLKLEERVNRFAEI